MESSKYILLYVYSFLYSSTDRRRRFFLFFHKWSVSATARLLAYWCLAAPDYQRRRGTRHTAHGRWLWYCCGSIGSIVMEEKPNWCTCAKYIAASARCCCGLPSLFLFCFTRHRRLQSFFVSLLMPRVLKRQSEEHDHTHSLRGMALILLWLHSFESDQQIRYSSSSLLKRCQHRLSVNHYS